MSKKGSKKEFIFNLILQRNTKLLSPFIGNVELFELEYDSVKRVDIYGRDLTHNSPIYIESQLGCSDKEHFEKLKYLIETNLNESGIFIWIASKFTDEYLIEIENLLRLHAKDRPIRILTLSLQQDYLKMLDKLNRQKDSDIWKQINQKGFVLPKLSLKWQGGGIPTGFKDSSVTAQNFPQKLTSKVEVNSYLLSVLRNEVPHLLNVHRSKKLTVNSIVFGSGCSDLSFVVNLAECEVAIRLENDWQSPLFQKVMREFKENKNFDFLLFDDTKIVFPIEDVDDSKEKVEKATKLFKIVVNIAIPIIYSHNKRFPTY